MKTLLTLIIVSTCWRTMAQETGNYTGNFENTSVTDAVADIEAQTNLKFYYDPAWADTLTFSGNFQSKPIIEVLESLADQTYLQFYLQDSKVYLTHKSRIISDLGISQFFDVTKPDQTLEKGLVFTREYLEPSRKNNPESKVYEIGRIGQLKRGETVTIAGYVKDIETGEPVEGAVVFINEPLIGTSADKEGFYSLTIPNGKQTIRINSLNMKNTFRKTVLFSSGTLNVDMEVDVIQLKAVIVNADRDINIKDAAMGVTRIDMKDTKNVPILLGERDLVKIATTTAGVQSIGEGASGVNIRGGKADQNMFLLDGTPVYNTSHFFGFFSVFNSASISSFDLYKSYIPAKHGGRLSSVFDIKTKDPNKEKFSGTGGVGPVTSNLLLEVPLIKEKTSLMVGGRGTYSNFVLDNVKGSSLGNVDASFADAIAKIHHTVNDRNSLSITGYYSFDSFQLASDSLLSYSDFSYENANFSSIWNHTFSDKMDGSLNVAMSRYDYNIGFDQLATQAFNIGFKVQETTAGADFNYYYSSQITGNFGVQFKRYDLNPGRREGIGSESLVADDKIQNEKGFESSAYGSVQYDPNDEFSLSGGFRYSIFNVLGPLNSFVYEEGLPRVAETRIDSISYGKNESIKTYQGPEWRFSARYSLDETSSVKMGVMRTRQNIHQLVNSASVAPTDIWRLSSEFIKPQIADQFSIGYYKNLHGQQVIETSVEVYYKRIRNLLDFKVGADLQFNKSVETDVLQGDGRTYGIEFSVKKTKGWFNGWINYTLSKTLIQLDGPTPSETVNGGVFFPTSYDQPHYFNSVTNYKITRRYSLSLNLVYSTGRPVTYPVGKWSFNGVENIYYSDRNEFRIPNYFRMDVGLNIEGNHKIRKLANSFWTFSVYNLLGRDNVFSIFFKSEDGEIAAYQLSVFPRAIPTITYNFSF